MATKADVIQRLASFAEDEQIAVAIWCREDVIGYAKDFDLDLSPEGADVILDRIHRKHDASIGINWNVLEVYILDYKTSQRGG